MMISAVLISLSPSSPWFYVLCVGVMIVAVAVILFCLFRRPKFVKTEGELDDLVGKTGVVTEEVDTDAGTGLVTIDGEGWAARSVYIDDVYAPGTQVQVVAIEGVKVIVKPLS